MQTGAIAHETATRTLHRLTSYEPGREWDVPPDDPRVRRDFEANDLERIPWLYKRYPPELSRIGLAEELPRAADTALAVLAGTTEPPKADLDLAQLARLLYLSAGVVRVSERRGRRHLFRASGSAGGRFPLELYVVVPEGLASIPRGVHWYDPEAHALVTVGASPAGDAAALVVTGVPGAPAGATASAANGTSTGTQERCSPSFSRSPPRPASIPTC